MKNILSKTIDKNMKIKKLKVLFLGGLALLMSCGSNEQKATSEDKPEKYPSDVVSNLPKWKILLGNGESSSDLINFEHPEFFYDVNDGKDWVVYKAPNGGITSPNSHNTRSELGEKRRWKPMEGGKLSGTLKVMHVSTKGDARVASSYSVVVGQIHSDDGHENEPLKIFYKKFPGHTKGSVFWNYEINTEGENDGRWDFSSAVWGYDMSVKGTDIEDFPEEPQDGIELGEVFSYEVNVYEGIMELTFKSEGHETKTFTKNLTATDFLNEADIPQQILNRVSTRRTGTEKQTAYAGENQFFKQGAYNQTNGKNMGDRADLVTYGGDLQKQYENGCYTEVWFSDSYLGPGEPTSK